MPDLTDTALADIGKVPYSFGAPLEAMFYRASLRRADCSSAANGWVKLAYGLVLPRTADDQFQATEKYLVVAHSPLDIPRNALVFFGGYPSTINPPGYRGIQHVGVSVGDGIGFIEETPPNVRLSKLADHWRYFIAATAPFGGIMREFDIVDQVAGTVVVTAGDARIAAIPIDGSATMPGITGSTFPVVAKVKLRIPVNSSPDSQVCYLSFHKGKLVALLARNLASFAPGSTVNVAERDAIALALETQASGLTSLVARIRRL